jgi:hypothetical protein
MFLSLEPKGKSFQRMTRRNPAPERLADSDLGQLLGIGLTKVKTIADGAAVALNEQLSTARFGNSPQNALYCVDFSVYAQASSGGTKRRRLSI